MNTSNPLFLASIIAAVFGSSIAQGQQPRRDMKAGPLAKLDQAFSAFSVDESASKAGRVSASDAETVVAGPIELHLPKLSKPTWMESLTLGKPPARASLNVQAVSSHLPMKSVPSTHQTVGLTGTVTRHLIPPNGYEHGIVDPDVSYMVGMPSPAHQVIRSPKQPQPADSRSVQGRRTIQEHADEIRDQHAQTHPDHSSIRRRVQPEPAMIPGGREQETWKQPYSYGYFGASGQRNWSLQHGYRDRYTQWSRR
jgi:hypothetical protein